MTKRSVSIEDARLVTVGALKVILKEEGVITHRDLRIALKEERAITSEEIARLEQKMNTKFSEIEEKFDRSMTAIADSFNRVYESISDIQKTMNIILDEFIVIREERNEFRQQREQLYRTEIIHERKIDELDTRLLKLETAK